MSMSRLGFAALRGDNSPLRAMLDELITADDCAGHVLETRGIAHELCKFEIVVSTYGYVINLRLVAPGRS